MISNELLNIDDFLNTNKDERPNSLDLSSSFLKEFGAIIKNKIAEDSIDNNYLDSVINWMNEDNRKNVKSIALSISKTLEKRNAEIARVKGMYNFDKHYGNYTFIAGVDEVGRGPLAGPIVSASVILDLNTAQNKDIILGIKDSKKLSPKVREELSEIIKEKCISYSISELDNNSIDERGISWCNNEVFRIAVSKLTSRPDLVISDGYPIRNFDLRNEAVIKGDAKSASIACASIIAKVYRDKLMVNYSRKYPYYGFENNMGYGTEEHILGLRKYGPCKIHRMCFLNNILG